MSNPVFEREVRASMQTLLGIVQANGTDGPGSMIRCAHHFAVLGRFDAPPQDAETLGNLANACRVALGGEELPPVPRPEVPLYRSHRSQWDPEGLRANLEACRRVGLRIRAWENPGVRDWLNYAIQTLERPRAYQNGYQPELEAEAV